MPNCKKEETPSFFLVRSRRKTLSIQLKPDGSLLVRAPFASQTVRIEEFVRSHRDWIEKNREKLRQRPAPLPLTPEKEKELRRLTRERVLPRVPYWSARVGAVPRKTQISPALKRWGSCSSKGTVSLSLMLGEQEEDAADYVIVHELCHLKEMNHSPRFWQLVESVLPDWRQRREKLRQAPGYVRPTVSEE